MEGITEFQKKNKKEIAVTQIGLGGLAKGVGQFAGGVAAKEQASFEAAVLRNNKAIVDRAADETVEEGRQKAQVKQLEIGQLIGKQRAALAGRNVVVDQDTAVELLLDAVRIGRLDEAAIRTNADRDALALRMQGASFETQAQLAERKGADAQRAGIALGLGTLGTTAKSVASKWKALAKKPTQPVLTRNRIELIQDDSDF